MALALTVACGSDDLPAAAGGTGGSGNAATESDAGGSPSSGGSAAAVGAGIAGSDAGDSDAGSGTGGTGAGTAGATGAAGAQGGASTGGAAGAPVSLICGDGVRGIIDEECDDGNSDDGDACRGDCRVNDFLIESRAAPTTSPFSLPARYLGNGRHPVAASASGFGVVFVEPDATPTRLSLATFDPRGVRLGVEDLGTEGRAVLFSDPVVAALPSGGYVAAWTDYGGDGDELGIALRSVEAGQEIVFANETRDFSQFDPDVLWTGTQLVVAWVDTADAFTGPDVRYRVFDSALSGGTELTLASSTASEADVALARFSGGWAAAWRASQAGEDFIEVEVKPAGTHWTVGPMPPGSFEDRPGLLQLDDQHLLVVFTEGTDPENTGLFNTPKLRGSILASGSPGATSSISLEPLSGEAGGYALAQTHPNAILIDASSAPHFYMAWRSSSAAGDSAGEQLWLREIAWDGSTLTLKSPIALRRSQNHETGDQRFPALAPTALGPAGAIAAAWDDYGRAFGGVESGPDVVVELIPTPILRLESGGDGGGQ